MKTTVNSNLGRLLDLVCKRLELPRGTRIGVRCGHRQVRSDLRFEREKLPKASEINVDDDMTLEAALDSLLRPRLPPPIRKKAKFVAFRPNERTAVQANVRLSTIRTWGDGHTSKSGEVFDDAVNSAINKLAPIWHETVEGEGEDEIFLRAVCYFYSHPKRVIKIVKDHFKAGENNIGTYW